MSQETERAPIKEEIKREAVRRAKEKARMARWDLDVAVFLFVVLIIVIILLFQDVGIVIVSSVAIFGLVMVWVVGWRRGQQLYQSYYAKELFQLEQEVGEAERKEGKKKEKTLEETIEETVQRALRERWK